MWLFEFISRSSSRTWSGSRALSSSPVTRSLPLRPLFRVGRSFLRSLSPLHRLFPLLSHLPLSSLCFIVSLVLQRAKQIALAQPGIRDLRQPARK